MNRLYQLTAIEVKDDTEITDCQCFCVGENEQDAADIAGHCDAHSPHWNSCEVCLIATAEDKTGQTHRVLLAAEDAVEHNGPCPNCVTQMEARWKADLAAKYNDLTQTITDLTAEYNRERAQIAAKDKEIARLREALEHYASMEKRLISIAINDRTASQALKEA